MESATEARVWRALSDPSRRRLLELLRLGPETTGALCEAFEMSRYGVMKHLSVLHDAGLVTVRREGRQRFNHLNAVPLQQIHRRFVRQFAERSGSTLLDLQDHLSAADAASDQPEELRRAAQGHVEQHTADVSGREAAPMQTPASSASALSRP